MPQRGSRERLEILLGDEQASAQHRARLRREQQRLPAARADTEAHEPLHFVGRGGVAGVRREDEARDERDRVRKAAERVLFENRVSVAYPAVQLAQLVRDLPFR